MRTAIVLLVLSLSMATHAQDAAERAAPIPFAPDSFDCAPEVFDPVRRMLAAFTLEDVETLLTSDDAHARGVGIYLAANRQYLDLLLAHPELADDRRPSLPNLICTPHAELPPVRVPKTVQARYLDSIQYWFGSSGSTSERQAALFPPEIPADSYARPWSRRIELVLRADEQTKDALRMQVLALPSDLRWVVLSSALPVEGMRELFTEADIRAEMKRLDDETKRSILSRTAKMPPDPMYRQPNAGHGLMRVAEALITDKPLPDPREGLPDHIKALMGDP